MARGSTTIRSTAVGPLLVVGLLSAAPALAAPRELHSTTVVRDDADVAGALDLVAVAAGQDGRALVLRLKTRQPLTWRRLAADPRRIACFLFARAGDGPPNRAACLRGHANGRPLSLATLRLDVRGAQRGPARRVAARVDVQGSGVTVRTTPEALGLRPGRQRFGAATTWTDAAQCAASPCVDAAPDSGLPLARFELDRVRPIGCTRREARLVSRGGARRRVVALTFDDGPGPYTAGVLAALRREHVQATFFALGQQMERYPSLARRVLAGGNVLADHSFDHANLAGAGPRAVDELRRTKRISRAATGFTPCLFRAPYGAVSGALIDVAAGLGMTTVQWDVDPRDWSLPGTDAVYSRVVDAVRPGSIVLLHDGGGPRSQTVAALPRIIDTLRRRGYRLATVPELLGGRVLFGRRGSDGSGAGEATADR